ncbi:hypothetical protein D9615_004641 [Tricholomella constricta]|uniref:PH domain-containing protein n=1 Tax=Tricholomella constricta TaxID=117010 RepID=A0A8H5HC15_9AGAR|nr:hypothetical protein D9615_004641 [Tricholomella constricta]
MLGPRSMDPVSGGTVSLQRHCSTKQLISRYESMSPGQKSRPVCRSAPASSTPLRAPGEISLCDLQMKEKSPIRQSFRNLFAVFKKANIRKGKQVEERPLSSFRRQHQPIVPSLDAPPVLRSRSRKLTSSLLYLSRTPQVPSKSPILPVWTSCTVTLESDSIVISCLTAHGNTSVHTILLSNCTDVRSLAMQQLDPEESALLPRRGDLEEFKVFEVLFEGRPREKFAANSVQERAGWVSAVWDTILPSQDPPTGVGNEPARADKITKESALSASCSLKSFVASYPRKYETLRPITGNTHARSPQPDELFISEYIPTNSTGLPSVLSGFSLYQPIYHEFEPTFGRATTPGTNRTKLFSVVPWHSPTQSQDMLRNQSGRSSAADSILDSYGDPIVDKASQYSPTQAVTESTEDLSDGKCPTADRKGSLVTSPVLESTVELLHDQSAKNYDQMENLGDQVLSLQNDIQRLPREIALAIDMDAHSNVVSKMVAKLEEQARSNGEVLGSIYDKMEKHQQRGRAGASDDSANLAQGLQSIREQLSKDLSAISTKLDSAELRNAASPTDMNNVEASRTAAVTSSTVDISGLHAKLDNVLAVSSATASAVRDTIPSSVEASKIEEKLTHAVALLEKDSTQQAVQAHQQGESVRYLNELNSWLEAFVNNGTSQLQSLSTGVEQLCRDLGSVEGGGSTVLADIRQLALSTAMRDQSSVALQASMDGLFAMLSEQSLASNIATVAALIDRQRQDHEGLMRALSSEISNEIKGERLRFVEAMKEATAINVQIHVEQFKKELKREVVQMTEEVGRLHQDRQAMQSQIADLFTFYTKQKAAEQFLPVASTSSNVAKDVDVAQGQSHPTTHARERPRSTGRRPLPQPRR